MASFKAKFPVLQELFFEKPQGGPLPPSWARVNMIFKEKLADLVAKE